MGSISILYDISKLVCSIALKIVLHALQHVLRLWYKFCEDMHISLEITRVFVIFVVIPLLKFVSFQKVG